ncbi:hypothetical protein B296_00005577 [Ensete ventricosum]|uniref:Uncharacterized protein n=1 Tax=Ensete ventricosum TaxID=4639 RepID=A0A427BC31_ENSVE|nr:hypothetical protein B296_00005577 [Ensete ventricosum]
MRAATAATIEEWRRKIGLLLKCDYIRGSQEEVDTDAKDHNEAVIRGRNRGYESGRIGHMKNESDRVGAIDGVTEVAVADGTVERGMEIRKAAPEVTKGEEEQL